MKIGGRVLKTGLAITLSIYLSLFLIPDNSASLAAIAAITTTLPSVRKSFDMLQRRALANMIGGAIAVFMIVTIGDNPLSIGIASIVTIAVLNAIGFGDVLSLACVTVVAVMLSNNDNFYITAIYRVLETIIGVTVSFAVNWLVYPPRHDKPFYSTLMTITNEILVFIRATLRKNVKFSVLHQDIQWARKELASLINLFELMRTEVIFKKKDRIAKARRLVIYRQMIKTTEAVIDLLTVLHNHDHVFKSFPDELRIGVRDRLETLMIGHEQIILKFSGRISASAVKFINADQEYKLEYMERFFLQAKTELEHDQIYDNDGNGVVHIMSAIYYYEESLIKLNRIIRIYKQRYTENKKEDEQLADNIL